MWLSETSLWLYQICEFKQVKKNNLKPTLSFKSILKSLIMIIFWRFKITLLNDTDISSKDMERL